MFQHEDMAGTQFTDVDLSGAVFEDVTLEGARFADINIRSATFKDVTFEGVTITDASTEGMTIEGFDVTALIQAEEARRAARSDGRARIVGIAPTLLVPDVLAAVEFYREKLGFSCDGTWGSPPCFAIARRDGMCIMLKQPESEPSAHPNYLHEPTALDVYLWVSDARSLYDELRQRGAAVTQEIETTEHGTLEFQVSDCCGYRLSFGQVL